MGGSLVKGLLLVILHTGLALDVEQPDVDGDGDGHQTPTLAKPDVNVTLMSKPCMWYSATRGDVYCKNKLMGPKTPSETECHIECTYGYVSSSSSRSTCIDGTWTTLLHCERPVAFLGMGFDGVLMDGFEVLDPFKGTCPHKIKTLKHLLGSTGQYMDGQIVICGGTETTEDSSDQFVSNQCYKYVPTADIWIKSTRLRSPRSDSASAMVGEAMFVVGGATYIEKDSRRPMPSKTTEMYSFAKKQFVHGPRLPTKLYDGCAVTLRQDHKMFTVVIANESVVRIDWPDDEGTDPKITSLPSLREPRTSEMCSSVWLFDHEGVIVAGGFKNGKEREPITSAEIFDPSRPNDGWRSIAQLPRPLANGAMLVLAGRPTVIGGIGMGDFSHDEVYSYDDETNDWREMAGLDTARNNFVAIAVPGSMFRNCTSDLLRVY